MSEIIEDSIQNFLALPKSENLTKYDQNDQEVRCHPEPKLDAKCPATKWSLSEKTRSRISIGSACRNLKLIKHNLT